MPIYEYKCADCATVFEILTTSEHRDNEVRCQKCNGAKVIKLLSASSVRKGSGLTPLPSAGPGCGGRSGFS
jgi:putative FmdB family regulatory protein